MIESPPPPAEQTPELSESETLDTLQHLLDADPDNAAEILGRLMPSADPEWVAEQINTLSAQTRGGVSPDDVPPVIPKSIFKPDVNPGQLKKFCAEFIDALGGNPLTKEEVESEQFQTKEDWYSYAFAPGAIGYHVKGMRVAPPLWRQLPNPARDLTHALRPEHDPSKSPLRLGLFADFGNGLYAPRAIARRLVKAKLPYVFHLGDVYYGGNEQQFQDYFREPLAPLIDHSELFILAGNHEMYAKGVHFQAFIKEKADKHKELQRQNGEMFRLMGHGLQIIGIDTMWNDWQGAFPQLSRAQARLGKEEKWVLEQWLSDAGPNTLTVLLTSDHPWDIGSGSLTPLHGDFAPYIQDGKIDFWFWGNVHYAALYERWQAEHNTKPGVIGSCIGHGGYPFYTQKPGKLPKGVDTRWIEQAHRFWPYDKVRPDVGANGWCEMDVEREASGWKVKLIYRDWVGRDRAIADISKKDGGGVKLDKMTPF